MKINLLIKFMLLGLCCAILPTACNKSTDDEPEMTVNNTDTTVPTEDSDSDKELKFSLESISGIWEGGSVFGYEDEAADGFVLNPDGWGYNYTGDPDNVVKIFYVKESLLEDGSYALTFYDGNAGSYAPVRNTRNLTLSRKSLIYKFSAQPPHSYVRKTGEPKHPLHGAWRYPWKDFNSIVLCPDGTGYSYKSRPERPDKYFSWTCRVDNVICFSIKYEQSDGLIEVLEMYELSPKSITFHVGSSSYQFSRISFNAPITAHGPAPEDPDNSENPTDPDDPTDPSEPSNPEDPSEPDEPNSPQTPDDPDVNDDPYDPVLANGYWRRAVSKYEDQEYYFYEDGTGYQEDLYMVHDLGIMRTWFKWTTSRGTISLKYENRNSPDEQLSYIVNGAMLTLTDSKGNTTTWNKRNTSAKVPYGQKPFANNYIYNKITGFYYSLSRVEEACEHAAAGENGNWKFLRFFGEDGYIDTTGGYIFYVTPYYDGIDSYWSEGTYKMLYSNNYYTYGAVLRTDKSQDLSSYNDKLTIKKNGNIHTYDYKGTDVEIHFVGTVK